jgi:hypothetical protein
MAAPAISLLRLISVSMDCSLLRVGADQRCKRPRTVEPRFDEIEFGLGQRVLRIEQFEQRKLARIVAEPCEPQCLFGLGDARTRQRLVTHFRRAQQHPRLIPRPVCIEPGECQSRFCGETFRLCRVDITAIAITHGQRDRNARDECRVTAFAKAPDTSISSNIRHGSGAGEPHAGSRSAAFSSGQLNVERFRVRRHSGWRILVDDDCRQFGIRTPDQRCQKLPANQQITESPSLLCPRFGKLRLGPQFTKWRVAANLDQQLCRAQKLLRRCHIVARQCSAVFGGAQIGVGIADVAFKIGQCRFVGQVGKVAFGARDFDARTALAAKLYPLANTNLRCG